VSINGIFTLIQYNSEIDQDSTVSVYFSQLFKSLVLTTRILTSVQNFYNIKNTHQSIQTEPTQFLYFQLFCHNLAHNLAHCLAHRLSIVKYCFRFAPLLHSCITYCFFICDAP
jgi:hypothetical protein